MRCLSELPLRGGKYSSVYVITYRDIIIMKGNKQIWNKLTTSDFGLFIIHEYIDHISDSTIRNTDFIAAANFGHILHVIMEFRD